MKKIILPILAIILTLISCNKDEIDVFDEPFVHINFNSLSTVSINSNRKDIVSYYINLSTKPMSSDMLLDYSIIIGDGLQAGVDFNILTTEYPLTFPSGIYRRPIQIQWLDHVLDPTKDNTLTIKLNSNNLGITVGLPGPDANQSELILQKINN